MYGRPDIYSPQTFGGIFADEDVFGALNSPSLAEEEEYGAHAFDDFGADDDEDDDEFGFLGIALTRKARQKKWDKKLARTMGKIKKLYEMGKLDRAQRSAKKLSKIVSKLEKVDEDFNAEENPELIAWMDFAETGDSSSLEQALSATAWTGEQVEPAAPPEPEYEDYPESGLVPASGGGVRGGPRPRRRRRLLPPGFRPGRYGMWRRERKIQWLSRHPNAASAPDPRDPIGWGGLRGRRLAGMAPAPAWGAPGLRPGLRPGIRPGLRPGLRPRRAATRRARKIGRSVLTGGKTRRVAEGVRVGPGGAVYKRQGRRGSGVWTRTGPRGHTTTLRAHARGPRKTFGAIEEAVTEVAEEMGALPGTIGIEAFPGVPSSGLTHALLTESDWLEDFEDQDDALAEEDEYLDDEDTTAAKIQNEGPQFAGVFRRKTEKRLEKARKKYERLRDRAVSPEDWDKVEVALRDYRTLAQAYKKAAVAPTPRKKEQALAALEEQPLFRHAAEERFLASGGSLKSGVAARPAPGMPSLYSEEAVWGGGDEPVRLLRTNQPVAGGPYAARIFRRPDVDSDLDLELEELEEV